MPDVTAAYAARAQEYTDLLGHLDATAAADRERVQAWAACVDGPIADVGCGPGHWSGFLARLGHDVCGLDPVGAFVDLAHDAYPDVSFERGSFVDLAGRPRRFAGVLAWYSLIHLTPDELPVALASVAAALVPGGRLLVGMCDGSRVERFDHAVAPAYRWPVEEFADLLAVHGFEVLDFTRRCDPGARPHADIVAVVR